METGARLGEVVSESVETGFFQVDSEKLKNCLSQTHAQRCIICKQLYDMCIVKDKFKQLT